jgi:quinohemoprotein ethanol dehydrogenase
MAFNPEAGLMYIPTTYSSYPFVAEAGAKMGNQLLSINVNKRPEAPAPELQGAGTYLMAWDPVQRQPVWEQRIAGSRAGVLATGGNLVFQSTGSQFKAFRGDTGEEVWSSEIQSGAVGGPVSYEIDGEQYVATVSGQGTGNYWAPNYARLLVYKIGGTAALPEMLSYTPPELNPPANFGDAALLARGEEQYTAHCASCHGAGVGRVSSIFPDLRYAAALNAEALFKAIVIDGVLQNNGMVSFAEQLTPEDAEAIRAYVVSLANAELQARAAPPAVPAAEVH